MGRSIHEIFWGPKGVYEKIWTLMGVVHEKEIHEQNITNVVRRSTEKFLPEGGV